MSEGEKTEAPTSRRVREARERGDVARSPLIGLGAMLIGLALTWRWGGRSSIEAWAYFARATWSDHAREMEAALGEALRLGFQALSPVLMVLLLIGVVTQIFQVGPLLSWKALEPQWERLSPGRNWDARRGGRVARMFLLAVLGVALSVLAVRLVREALEGLLGRNATSAEVIFGVAEALGMKFGQAAGVLIVVAGLLDLWLHRIAHQKALRMTRAERRREEKSMYGDPTVRERRRRAYIELDRFRDLPAQLSQTAFVIFDAQRVILMRWRILREAPTVLGLSRGPERTQWLAQAGRYGLPCIQAPLLAANLSQSSDPVASRAQLARIAKLIRRHDLHPKPFDPDPLGALRLGVANG